MKTSQLVWLTMLTLLASCTDQPMVNTIKVATYFDKQLLNCKNSILIANNSWQYQQIYFYISQVELKDSQGNWQPWPMKDTTLQSNNVALLGEECTNENKAVNSAWQIDLADVKQFGQYSALRFALGVPFAHNHLNPLTQKPPLNDANMFWVWQLGHKFLRLEMFSQAEQWLFHLGSTGCRSASVMRSPDSPCQNPNLFTFTVPIEAREDNKPLTLAFNLATLLKGVEVNDNSHCQSSIDDLSCQQLFANLTNTKVFKVL